MFAAIVVAIFAALWIMWVPAIRILYFAVLGAFIEWLFSGSISPITAHLGFSLSQIGAFVAFVALPFRSDVNVSYTEARESVTRARQRISDA